jgi:dipeptide/tripeptide permease
MVSAGLTQAIAVWMGTPFALAMAVVAMAVPLATFLLCKLWVFAPPQTGGP